MIKIIPSDNMSVYVCTPYKNAAVSLSWACEGIMRIIMCQSTCNPPTPNKNTDVPLIKACAGTLTDMCMYTDSGVMVRECGQGRLEEGLIHKCPNSNSYEIYIMLMPREELKVADNIYYCISPQTQTSLLCVIVVPHGWLGMFPTWVGNPVVNREDSEWLVLFEMFQIKYYLFQKDLKVYPLF